MQQSACSNVIRVLRTIANRVESNLSCALKAMFGGSNHCTISDLSPLRPSWENSFQSGTILCYYHIPSEKITRPSLSSIHGLHPDNFIFFLSDTRLSSDALLPNPFAVTGLLVGGSEAAISSTHLLFSVPSEDKMRQNLLKTLPKAQQTQGIE